MIDTTAFIQHRWKLITMLTLAATLLALAVSLLRPKEYLGTVTALPANTATTDKARVLNTNIEGLYPELGTADELDKIEGTVQLDTLYLAVAQKLLLATHYHIAATEADAPYKAANSLRRQTEIRRSAYGELKIKVWDKDAVMAARMANQLLQTINEVHGELIQANNEAVLMDLRKSLLDKERQLDSLDNQLAAVRDNTFDTASTSQVITETTLPKRTIGNPVFTYKIKALQESIAKHTMLIEEYALAVNLHPQLLLPVEMARPTLWSDRPKILQTVFFAFGASLLFSVLLALMLQSRKLKA